MTPLRADLFVGAQEILWPRAVLDLAEGQKRAHWIWPILPQIKGLAESPRSVLFALDGVEQAQEFLLHPILGPRYHQTVELLVRHGMYFEWGSSIDRLKAISSLTLFERAAEANLPISGKLDFGAGLALDRCFDGHRCARTLAAIGPTCHTDGMTTPRPKGA